MKWKCFLRIETRCCLLGSCAWSSLFSDQWIKRERERESGVQNLNLKIFDREGRDSRYSMWRRRMVTVEKERQLIYI